MVNAGRTLRRSRIGNGMSARIGRIARWLDIAGALAVAVATLAGLAIFAINNVPDANIWLDESGQYWLSQGLHHDSALDAQPGSILDGIWFGRNGFNLDPPGFTVFLAGWVEIFGSGIVSLRALPFVMFSLTFIPAYLLGTKGLKLPRTLCVLLPALVLTLSLPLQYSTEIRAYSAELLAVVLTAWAAVRAYQSPGTRTTVILCLVMLFGATSTRYSYLVAASAVLIAIFGAMVFGATLRARWRELTWPVITYALIGLFTAWSVGLFGDGRQYDYGRGYSDSNELWTLADWPALQERLAHNLWWEAHQATGLFLISGFVLAILVLILRLRTKRKPHRNFDVKAQNGVLVLWGFALAYELSAVAFSYVGVVPWYAGDRHSIGLEALALVSWLGLAGIIAYVTEWALRSKDPDLTSVQVNTAKLVAMVLLLVVSIPLTTTFVTRLSEFRHWDFRIAGSKLSAIAEQAFPPGAQVDWLVDYWSWPTFRYEVLKTGTFPTTFQIASATPIRLSADQDGAEVLTSQQRCGPNLWTAVLHENWGADYATRNSLYAAKASAMRCVTTVYQISNDESLIVLGPLGGVN